MTRYKFAEVAIQSLAYYYCLHALDHTADIANKTGASEASVPLSLSNTSLYLRQQLCNTCSEELARRERNW